ncbi:MAG TPA: class I SAM-dependent methyltransferase [Acidimicrobiia bacterium]|nr:class I SAM-dependent methyltransferase [Acidimicrobiia bacterium]
MRWRPKWLQPGSDFRSELRRRFPRLRGVVIAPRRWLRSYRWRRYHRRVSVADRLLLEQTILPALRADVERGPVLFVGVAWYTAGYPALFPPGGLVTVDADPGQARYGSERHHVVDVLRVGTLFSPRTFSAIVCNGVFGYGVDTEQAIVAALDAFRLVLEPGGALVVGWNDLEGRRPPELEPLARRSGFLPSSGAGLSSWRVAIGGPTKHVYDVYRCPIP